MNTATTAKASMPYRPEPTPPKITSPSCISHIGTRPPSGVSESCAAFTAPHEAAVVMAANRPRSGDAEACFLAFHVAARLQGRGLAVHRQPMQRRVAGLFGGHQAHSAAG